MAAGGDESCDFYAVLGLKKECTEAELRNAYKKLALRWHPDRCAASGNVKFVDEAKKKFQAIQGAYSVLSDANKRFLYDVGVYDCDDDDDDQNGMADFLNEMADMMSQNKANEKHGESFEDLQDLFHEMFQSDIEAYGLGVSRSAAPSSCSSSSSCVSSVGSSNVPNKRSSLKMNSGKTKVADYPTGFSSQFEGFSLGVEHQENNPRRVKRSGEIGTAHGGAGNKRRRSSSTSVH